MRIEIKQHVISIGSQYKIYLDHKEQFYAETDFFSKSIINVYELNSIEKRLIIYKSLYFTYPKYKIELPSGERYKFRTKNFWKTQFQFIKDGDVYDLYCHKERKVSIYKNDIQIAYWEKEAMSYLAGDYYEIISDKNCSHDLIISFCLILDNILSKGGFIFNIDFGILFHEVKKFNMNWKPT